MVAELKEIKIEFDTSNLTDNIEVRGDIDMVKTVVRNLITNAIKFSNPSSTIKIKIRTDSRFAIVAIEDFGCGIDDEDQKKLLHEDTHFSTFGTNNEEGSGLGLLLCKDFIVKNNGDLWFTSEKNKGSIFSFSVPLVN